MMDLGRFVCGFPGRRDAYQVPAALAVHGALDLFLTDFYWNGRMTRLLQTLLPSELRSRARLRQNALIPNERVRILWLSTIQRELGRLLPKPPAVCFSEEGIRFAKAATIEARRRRANLFLYPPCAYEAFTSRYPGYQPLKILFQFHPHPGYQEALLAEDFKSYPELATSYRNETWHDLPDSLKLRDHDSWRHADLLICASSFTRSTLLAAGANPNRCRVVPYGVDEPHMSLATTPRAGFHVLFVGNATQRKGLHHLVSAWNRASLPEDSSLTIVARWLDPGMRPALSASRRTTIHEGGLPSNAVRSLFQTSTLFAMPSLVEGFGAVFLEALCNGCPVLGTRHTCLPDLGSEKEAIFLAPVGDIDALVAQLERLSQMLPAETDLRTAAAKNAARFTWKRFRDDLVESMLKNSND